MQWLLMGLMSACGVLLAQSDLVTATLEFHGQSVREGQVWRMFTAHLCHANMSHMLMNVGACAMLFSLFREIMTAGETLLVMLMSALLISVGYVSFYPPETRYLGLSGVLHALVIVGALAGWARKRVLSFVLLVGLAVKLFYENTWGASDTLAQIIGARVATEAHWMGAAAGLIWGMSQIAKRKYLGTASAL